MCPIAHSSSTCLGLTEAILKSLGPGHWRCGKRITGCARYLRCLYVASMHGADRNRDRSLILDTPFAPAERNRLLRKVALLTYPWVFRAGW